jgi:FkbM family methyltransferase
MFDVFYRRSILSPEYRALRHIRALERFSKGRLPVTITNKGSYVERGIVKYRVGDLPDGTYGAPPPETLYEEAIYRLFLAQLRARTGTDLTIIDVGANAGLVSLSLAADSEPKITVVYAIEPSRRTYAILKENCSLNPSLQVKPYRLALSDTNGTLSLTSDGGTGNHLVQSGRVHSERVKAQTMESFCRTERINRVDGIKIDVEGAELLVLKGAKEVLRRDRPVIMIEIQEEWTRRFGYKALDVFTALQEYQYCCLTPTGTPIKDGRAFTKNAMKEYNFVFVPEKKK